MSLSLPLSPSRFPSLLVARSRVEQVLGPRSLDHHHHHCARVQATIAAAHYYPDRHTNTITTAPAVAFSVSFRPAIPTLRRCRASARRALLDLCPSPISPRPIASAPFRIVSSAAFLLSSILLERSSPFYQLKLDPTLCFHLSLSFFFSLPRLFFLPFAHTSCTWIKVDWTQVDGNFRVFLSAGRLAFPLNSSLFLPCVFLFFRYTHCRYAL